MTNHDDISSLENQIESLGESLDGGDIFLILSLIADANDDDLFSVIDSDLGKEIIWATQSNPVQAIDVLRDMAELDENLSKISYEEGV